MAVVDNIADEFRMFAGCLTTDRTRELERIEQLANGFEG